MESERDKENCKFGAVRAGLIVPATVPPRVSCHYSHPFDIPRHRNQRPFPSNRCKTTQQELPEAHYRLDDAEHGLHRLLAQGIERTPLDRFELMFHSVHVARRLGERWRLGESVFPIRVM